MQVIKKMLFLSTILLNIIVFSPMKSSAINQPVFHGITGNNQGRFNEIGKTSLDAEGNIYIVDSGNHRIQKFGPNGNFLKFYGGFGSLPGQFNVPWSVTVDNQGYIYMYLIWKTGVSRRSVLTVL